MSFGRKGLAADQAVAATPMRGFGAKPQPQMRQSAPVVTDDDPHSAAREAFIASERARNGMGGAQGSEAIVPASPAGTPRQQYEGPVETHHGSGQIRKQPGFLDQFSPDNPSLALAYILWFFLGNCGAHRFYLGQAQGAFYQVGVLVGSLFLALTIHAAFAIGVIVWMLWLLSDVFFIHKWHKKRLVEAKFDPGVFG